MAEKNKFADEMLTDDELDNIFGGSNGYVYYARVERPGIDGYYLVFSEKPMLKEEVRFCVYTTPHIISPFIDYKDKAKFLDIAKAKGYEAIDYDKMKN
ncbi:MAG: hypothetical protein II857_00910 [Selenomonadaceae bacterium]|nr:hypothetical protein [Selenomonadaceae bacterium]